MGAYICNRCGHEAGEAGPCKYEYPPFGGHAGRKCNGTVKAHADRVPWTHKGFRK